MNNNTLITLKSGLQNAKNYNQEVKKEAKLPTLEQYMELITNENISMASTPTSYNSYKKYNKGC